MNEAFSPKRRELMAAAVAAGTAALLPSALQAQTQWPTKSIRFLVPFAPGGTSEIVARSVAAELTRQLGQTVYVENKPGGAGVVAMSEAARAAPDGYTIILGHVGTLAVNPYMLANQPYDVNKDFIPVTLLAKVPNVFVIHPDVPAKNFKEFVAYVKANPGKLSYGSAGNASAGHLAMEYLKLVTGMFITHIPYRGTGPQLTDLLAGRTQASSAGLPALGAHIRAGKLRAIAVGTQHRISALPDVPTVAEMGFKDFETSQWYGILAPAGTPPDVVEEAAGRVVQGAQVERGDRALRHRQRGGRRRAVVRVRGLHRARAEDLEGNRETGPDQGRLNDVRLRVGKDARVGVDHRQRVPHTGQVILDALEHQRAAMPRARWRAPRRASATACARCHRPAAAPGRARRVRRRTPCADRSGPRPWTSSATAPGRRPAAPWAGTRRQIPPALRARSPAPASRRGRGVRPGCSASGRHWSLPRPAGSGRLSR